MNTGWHKSVAERSVGLGGRYRGRMVEHLEPEYQEGDVFILRSAVKAMLDRSEFVGDQWEACKEAALAQPGLSLLKSNYVTRAKASDFLKLFTRPDKRHAVEDEACWPAFHDRLRELGDQLVQELHVPGGGPGHPVGKYTWVLFVDPGLVEVLAFNGWPRPGQPSYDEFMADFENGTEVVETVYAGKPLRIERILARYPDCGVDLRDDEGREFRARFPKFMTTFGNFDVEDEPVLRVTECKTKEGWTWFLFEREDPEARCVFAQAEEMTWESVAPKDD